MKKVFAIILFAISGSYGSANSNKPGAVLYKAPMAQAQSQVIINHMAYSPASITITKGTKVTWLDKQGIMPHTVTSDAKGLFNSGNMHKNDTFSYTFNNAGTFTYYCKHHEKMHGKVIVQ
jgi:plastocyanin